MADEGDGRGDEASDVHQQDGGGEDGQAKRRPNWSTGPRPLGKAPCQGPRPRSRHANAADPRLPATSIGPLASGRSRSGEEPRCWELEGNQGFTVTLPEVRSRETRRIVLPKTRALVPTTSTFIPPKAELAASCATTE